MEHINYLSDYEYDCMWMVCRYCIGSHTIACHSMAREIAKNCYGRLSEERSIFQAYDINREIESHLMFSVSSIYWNFPLGHQNSIYTSAIDIFCQFLEDFDITTKEEYLKYKTINVILTDNERGYKFEVETWEEYLRPHIHDVMKVYFDDDSMSEDDAWNYFNKWRNGEFNVNEMLKNVLNSLILNMPNPEHFYSLDIEDLFVWNDLCHLFDLEHHYKVELIDGTIEEVFETYTQACDEKGYRIPFKYKKIICPAEYRAIGTTVYIPNENIKNVIK